MAGSPPALPGFGNSGKSFLIDNLLQSQTPSARPEGTAGGYLRRAACERPRRTWVSEHGAYQSQAHSPQQGKDLGAPLVPHSGKHFFLMQADLKLNLIYLDNVRYFKCDKSYKVALCDMLIAIMVLFFHNSSF